VAKHVVLAAGGGLRGLIHKHTTEKLVGTADVWQGNSIGALIAASASCRIHRELFHQLETAETTKSFFRLSLDFADGLWKDGLFSPKPWEKAMEKNRLCEGLHEPTWVGMCDPALNEYVEVRLNDLTPEMGRDAVKCSGLQSPAMEIRTFRDRVYIDAGLYKHVIPPVWRTAEDIGKVTVLANSPLRPEQRHVRREQSQVNRSIPLLNCLFDDIISRVVLDDYAYLKALAKSGVEVEIFAPNSFDQVYATFDTSREARNARLRTADWLMTNSVTL